MAASSPIEAPRRTRLTATTDAVGLRRVAHFPDLDVIRRSRLKKSTLFEMEASPELIAVQEEYLRLAQELWDGYEPLDATPMKDRDLFEFLGFD